MVLIHSGQLLFPVCLIPCTFSSSGLIQLNLHGFISCLFCLLLYTLNASEEFHLQCSESSLFLYLLYKSKYSTLARAKILYKLTCVSNLPLLLDIFASIRHSGLIVVNFVDLIQIITSNFISYTRNANGIFGIFDQSGIFLILILQVHTMFRISKKNMYWAILVSINEVYTKKLYLLNLPLYCFLHLFLVLN